MQNPWEPQAVTMPDFESFADESDESDNRSHSDEPQSTAGMSFNDFESLSDFEGLFTETMADQLRNLLDGIAESGEPKRIRINVNTLGTMLKEHNKMAVRLGAPERNIARKLVEKHSDGTATYDLSVAPKRVSFGFEVIQNEQSQG